MGKFGDHKLLGIPGTVGQYRCQLCGLELDARTDSFDVQAEKERRPCEEKGARPGREK